MLCESPAAAQKAIHAPNVYGAYTKDGNKRYKRHTTHVRQCCAHAAEHRQLVKEGMCFCRPNGPHLICCSPVQGYMPYRPGGRHRCKLGEDSTAFLRHLELAMTHAEVLQAVNCLHGAMPVCSVCFHTCPTKCLPNTQFLPALLPGPVRKMQVTIDHIRMPVCPPSCITGRVAGSGGRPGGARESQAGGRGQATAGAQRNLCHSRRGGEQKSQMKQTSAVECGLLLDICCCLSGAHCYCTGGGHSAAGHVAALRLN